jgi:hypothetical protein
VWTRLFSEQNYVIYTAHHWSKRERSRLLGKTCDRLRVAVAPAARSWWRARLQRDSHGVEFGLDDGSELGLQLELALQALNLDLLLLDEAPLFFKLRANSVSLNHFPSLKKPPLI